MKSDTSEKGLESLIVAAMTAVPPPPPPPTGDRVSERPATYGPGWLLGDAKDYDREYAIDLVQLRAFVAATQPALTEAFDLDRDPPVHERRVGEALDLLDLPRAQAARA